MNKKIFKQFINNNKQSKIRIAQSQWMKKLKKK